MSEERVRYGDVPSLVRMEVDLTEKEAWAFGEFLKRIGFPEFRSLAASEAEAYEMQTAGEKIREAILEHLETLEDIALAEERIANIRAGHSKTVPFHQVGEDVKIRK